MKRMKLNYKNDKTFKEDLKSIFWIVDLEIYVKELLSIIMEAYNQITKYFDEDILLSDINIFAHSRKDFLKKIEYSI